MLGGLTFVAVFLTHGAIFLALRTTDDLRVRANQLATRTGVVAAVLTIAFLAWAQALRGDTVSVVFTIAAVIVFAGGLVANLLRREGWAFIGTTVAIGLAVVSLFIALFPDVMPSTLEPGSTLTAVEAASSSYTLKAMTIITAIFFPLVLLYQGWTYWVFRKRVMVAAS
jgi:cytochrome d ubiquinol oxidase subunit II